MNVAAFFKDSRVRSALAGSPPAQATLVLADFFARFSYGDCAPSELLALADLAARGGDSAVARVALEALVRNNKRLHLAHYKLGRLDIADESYADAAAHFRAGAAADADFAFNWMGAARALHAIGQTQEAVEFAERFASFGLRPHSTSELPVLAEIADHLFDAGERTRAARLYGLVVQFGADRPRDAVRLAEGHMARGDYQTALDLLHAQEKLGRLEAWGRRAMAVCYSHTGEHALATALGERVALDDPANEGFAVTYLDVVARAGQLIQMRDTLERHGGLLPEFGRIELAARIDLIENRVATAAARLEGLQPGHRTRLYHLCFEIAYAALAAGLLDIATTLATRLGTIAPQDIYVKLLLVDSYFRQQLWEPAGEILASMSADEQAIPHAVLKRFEYASFVGDHAAAETLLAELDALPAPNKQFLLPVFRFLAEQNKWDEVVGRALPWLDAQLNYTQIGYVLYRAAKHTSRHGEMIAAVEAVPNWQSHPDLVRLRANLAFDRAETLPQLDALGRDPTVAEDPVMRAKLDVRRHVLASALAHSSRRAIFLCTDRNYLAATIAALHSLSRVTDRASVDFFVVLDDDLLEMAQRFTASFIEAGFTLTLVPASTIIAAAEKLHAAYGLFTSGHVLSSAAYYRIYFAKYLSDLGLHDRAIYVDSDILVRSSLESLFLADMDGQPLAARAESMRPEVRRATTLHKLEDGAYFNSGVLLFDLKSERLAAGLAGAIAAIMDDQVTLLYHDQCALNLGFRGAFTKLDPVWNFPVNEPTTLAEIAPGAAVLHFLDRPKPWSAAHGGAAAVLWFENWRETAAFIGAQNAVEVFAQVQD